MGGFQLCDVTGSMPGLYNQIMPTLLRGGHFQNLLKNVFGLLGEIGKVRSRQWSEFWERVSIQVDVTFAGSTISGTSTGGRLRQLI